MTITTLNGKKIQLNNLDMDRIKSKMFNVNDIQVFTTLRLDSLTNSKVLTIASPILFVNHTDKDFIL